MYSTPEARAIRRQLEQNAQKKLSQQPSIILKTDIEVIGTPTPIVRKLSKKLWNSFRRNTDGLFLVLKDLWGKAHDEQMLVCYVLNLGLKQESLSMLQFALNNLFETTSDWAVSDLLGKFIGQYMALHDELIVREMISSSLSPLQKRVIIASLVELIRSERGKKWITTSFQIVQSFTYDDELLVKKAIRKFIKVAYRVDAAKTIAILYDWALKRVISSAHMIKFYAKWIPKEHLEGILEIY